MGSPFLLYRLLLFAGLSSTLPKIHHLIVLMHWHLRVYSHFSSGKTHAKSIICVIWTNKLPLAVLYSHFWNINPISGLNNPISLRKNQQNYLISFEWKTWKIQSVEDRFYPLFLVTLYECDPNSVKNHQEFSRKSILKAPPGAFVFMV